MASVDLGTLRRHHGFCVWLTTCARGSADPLGRFCDTMRGGTWVAVGVVCLVDTCIGLVGSLGTAAAIPWSVGWQTTTCTWCRSVPLGTLCDTMRWCAWSIVVSIRLGCRRSGRFGDTIRLGRWVPGGWVGLFALVKCYTCLRGASGARLLTFGLQLVCTGWGGSGSDLDGRGPTRAHKIVSCNSSHSVQRHTYAGENHGVVYLHGEELLAVR